MSASKVEQHSLWGQETSYHILIDIFSQFVPEEIMVFGEVCKLWQQVSHNEQIYQTLSARFHYFNRKNGALFFTGNEVCKRFLRVYKHVQKFRPVMIDHHLPHPSLFIQPFEVWPASPFPDFNYVDHREAIFSYLHLGGPVFKEDDLMRCFGVACYFGDVDMVMTIKNTSVELKPEHLLSGVIFGVMGKHAEVVKKIRSFGVQLDTPAIFNISWRDYLTRYARLSPEIQAAIAR